MGGDKREKCLAVKRTRSSRGPEFSSQTPVWRRLTPCNPSPRKFAALFWPLYVSGTHTACTQAKETLVPIKKNKKQNTHTKKTKTKRNKSLGKVVSVVSYIGFKHRMDGYLSNIKGIFRSGRD